MIYGRGYNLLNKLRGNAGFTLLEVLAVVALLGVLGAMLLPSLDSAQPDALKTPALKATWQQLITPFCFIKWITAPARAL